LTHCQIVNSDSVEALAVEMQGKTDKKPVRRVLLSNDDYPEFCPVRHLLWYIKTFNLRTGYLFPDREALLLHWQNSRCSEFNPEKHMSYTSFLCAYKKLVGEICKRDMKLFKVGTHTCLRFGATSQA
jgi:hypothetical protein